MRNKFTLAIMLLIAVLFATVFLGYIYGWRWTGLTGYFDDSNNYQSRLKTLWDWMDLLLVPAVLAAGGYWFQQTTKAAEQQAAEQRASTDRVAAEKRAGLDREIAAENFRSTTLQTYLANMSDLLIKENLLQADEGRAVRTVGRAMTLTTLRRLDSIGKGAVIAFLSESRLITATGAGKPIIDLQQTDLTRTNLHHLDLTGTNLTWADLSGAILMGTNLSRADLSGTSLSSADLSGANLSDSNLYLTDLSGAVLGEADLSRADLREAIYDKRTMWPSGFIPPPEGLISD